MKHGRPALRSTAKNKISGILRNYPFPATVQTVQRGLFNSGKAYSWYTVKKYLDELVEEGIITRRPLPSDGKHKPLIVYSMCGRRS